jgi:hypothetical protein
LRKPLPKPFSGPYVCYVVKRVQKQPLFTIYFEAAGDQFLTLV